MELPYKIALLLFIIAIDHARNVLRKASHTTNDGVPICSDMESPAGVFHVQIHLRVSVGQNPPLHILDCTCSHLDKADFFTQ